MGKLELEFPRVIPKLKEEFELRLREEIIRVLIANNGNVVRTAEELGTKRTTLVMYIRKFDLKMYTKTHKRKENVGE